MSATDILFTAACVAISVFLILRIIRTVAIKRDIRARLFKGEDK